MSTATDSDLFRWLAVETGAMRCELRCELRSWVGDTASSRREGDRGAQDFLATQLARHRPDDVVLSEEASDDTARLAASRVWIVDPLDGTHESGEPGRTDSAVHVALCQRGELTSGAVALPALELRYATDRAIESPPSRPAPLATKVSRTRPPEQVHRLAQRLDAEIVPMGSAGAKVTAVVRCEVDVFLHAGGQ